MASRGALAISWGVAIAGLAFGVSGCEGGCYEDCYTPVDYTCAPSATECNADRTSVLTCSSEGTSFYTKMCVAPARCGLTPNGRTYDCVQPSPTVTNADASDEAAP